MRESEKIYAKKLLNNHNAYFIEDSPYKAISVLENTDTHPKH